MIRSLVIASLLAVPMMANAQDVSVLVGYKAKINHASVQARGGQVRHEWKDLRAVAVRMPASQVAALRANPEIEYVEEDRTVRALAYSAEETWGNIAIHAPEVRTAGYIGTGITVCIIDSGIDPAHPEFKGSGFAGGYDYVDNDATPTDKSGTTWGTGHGTHVSGTVMAQFTTGGIGGNIVGVAPGVKLYMYRVLGIDGSGSTSAVINGLKACQALPGLKIASLSLGSSTKSTTEQRAFDAAYSAGVLIFAAAGNDGNTRTSYPAGYASVISVAAVDSTLAHASFSQVNKDVEISAPGVAVFSSVPVGTGLATDVSVANVDYASNSLEYSPTGSVTGTLIDCGLCDSTASCTSTPAGFVAYCDRGTVAFADKVNNAKAQGAAAVIIANNDTTVPDDAGSFTLGAAGAWLPSVSVSYNSGVAMQTKFGSSATVSLFSSDYATWDGTSMATPHASACAALVWQKKNTLSASSMRTLLTSTAKDLGARGRDTSFGYGLIDCLAALNK